MFELFIQKKKDTRNKIQLGNFSHHHAATKEKEFTLVYYSQRELNIRP